MPMEYKNLDQADKDRIRGDIQGRDVDETDYEAFLPAWEAEHFSHSVLLEQATLDKDEDAAEAAREAMAALELSVTNVRAGNKPDGSPHPGKPVPPAPADPVPAPTDPAPAPTDPAPAPTDPAPAPTRP